MKNIKLKLSEIYQLHTEINGLRNTQTNEFITEGLLKKSLLLKTKFWMTDLSNKISPDVTQIDSIREGLIMKYGEIIQSGYSLPLKIEQDGQIIINPKYIMFENDFNSFLMEEKEISYNPFKIDEFKGIELNHGENLNVFYKLIEV